MYKHLSYRTYPFVDVLVGDSLGMVPVHTVVWNFFHYGTSLCSCDSTVCV